MSFVNEHKQKNSILKKFFLGGGISIFLIMLLIIAIPILVTTSWNEVSNMLGFSNTEKLEEEYLKNFSNRGKSAFGKTEVKEPFNPFESTDAKSAEKWVLHGYTNSLSPFFTDPRIGKCPLGWENLPGVKEIMRENNFTDPQQACQWCQETWEVSENIPQVCTVGCAYSGGPPSGGPYQGWPIADYELKGGHRTISKLHFNEIGVFAADFAIDTTEQVETIAEIPVYSTLNGQVVEIGFDPTTQMGGRGHGVFVRIQNTRQYDYWKKHGTGLAYIERVCAVNWEIVLYGLTPNSPAGAGIQEGSLVAKGQKIGTMGQSAGSSTLSYKQEKHIAYAAENEWETILGGGGDNTKFGVNTTWLYENYSQQYDYYKQKTRDLGMGYFLETVKYQGGDQAIAAALQSAIDKGLNPIIRLCDSHYCEYGDVNYYVDLLTYLDEQVNGKFYAVTGPNEPLIERWLEGLDENSTVEEIAHANVTYMNSVIQAIQGHDEIGLLSPIFNCTNAETPNLITTMHNQGAQFSDLEGIAGNSYNLNYAAGRTITSYLETCQNVFSDNGITAPYDNFFIAEMGMYESEKNTSPQNQSPIPHEEAKANLRKEVDRLRGNNSVKAALFFNALGTNPSEEFAYNIISDDSDSGQTARDSTVGEEQSVYSTDPESNEIEAECGCWEN